MDMGVQDTEQELVNALYRGEIEIVETLLDAHPDFLNSTFCKQPAYGFIPLALAISRQHNALAEALIQRGALVTSDTIPPHHLPLFQAIVKHNKEGMELLLEHGASFADIEKDGATLRSLWREVFRTDMDRVKPILSAGASVTAYEAHAQRESSMDSFLSQAIAEDYHSALTVDLLNTLVEHGASIHGFDKPRHPPLFVAVLANRESLVDALIKLGADPKCVNAQGESLLFVGLDVYKLKPGLRKKIFKMGVDPDIQNSEGITALHRAAEQYEPEYAQALLDSGAKIDVQDHDGNTPLLTALKAGSKDLAATLINAGADVHQADHQGLTPLAYCRQNTGYKRLQKLLEKQGAGASEPEDSKDDFFQHLKPEEPWAVTLLEAIHALPAAQQKIWGEFLELSMGADSSKPSKTWQKKARALLFEQLDPIASRAIIQRSVERVADARTAPPAFEQVEDDYSPWSYAADSEARWYFDWRSTNMIRGLCWLMTDVDDSASLLREVATAHFKKVPGIGMRNAKIGNAALYALSQMSGNTGLKELAILREQTRYNPALTNIKRVFDQVAKARNTSVEELAESAVSDYGMQGIGIYDRTLGGFTAQVRMIQAGKTTLSWLNHDNDKVQKSVPAALKGEYDAEIKQLKALIKDLQKAGMAQRRALERLYLEPKTWSVQEWRERYIEHPLCAFLGRRLLWRFHPKKGNPETGIWFDDAIRDLQQHPLDLAAFEKVELWHPVYDNADNIEAWRMFLLTHEIVQPFKQAHREIYIVTDAERQSATNSTRFAGHILRQHQVHALAEDRGWRQTLGGSWDGGDDNDAYRNVPSAQLSVVYSLNNLHDLDFSASGIYMYCSGGTVEFYRQQRVLEIEQVPPLVFSEIMRDVDLFVAIASVGNDPDWEHRQQYNYWSDYSCGELAPSGESRKQVLEAILPKLKIAKQTEIKGRFLYVTGKLRTYKIHLGSANILMEPNDQYLCIVETRDKTSNLYLPFEGDSKLSLILSKAFLLAADDKIKDQTILSQIKRG